MRVIGLTGGIASGKSTVAALLRERGVLVLDADQIAREVVEPGTPALAQIGARWPAVIVDGRLDRKALGKLVFSSPEERLALNAIVHPAIQGEVIRRSADAAERGVQELVYEAALLFENNLDKGLAGTILVAAPEAVQVARLRDRDGLPEPEARQRLAAQLPLDEKRRRATWTIENDGTLEELRAKVHHVWRAACMSERT